jgi:hypothetical protein
MVAEKFQGVLRATTLQNCWRKLAKLWKQCSVRCFIKYCMLFSISARRLKIIHIFWYVLLSWFQAIHRFLKLFLPKMQESCKTIQRQNNSIFDAWSVWTLLFVQRCPLGLIRFRNFFWRQACKMWWKVTVKFVFHFTIKGIHLKLLC